MLKRAIISTTVIATIALAILLTTTTPLSTGPLGILGFFVFMYITVVGVLTLLFRCASLIAPKFLFTPRGKARIKEVSLRKAYYYASVVALAPVMLIAMQSVGEIGVYQLLLTAFFVVIAWLYVTKRTT